MAYFLGHLYVYMHLSQLFTHVRYKMSVFHAARISYTDFTFEINRITRTTLALGARLIIISAFRVPAAVAGVMSCYPRDTARAEPGVSRDSCKSCAHMTTVLRTCWRYQSTGGHVRRDRSGIVSVPRWRMNKTNGIVHTRRHDIGN